MPNDFVFLFGQHKANKSDLFNVFEKDSLINKFVETI